MKIGFIEASAGTISGGMETFVYQMATALSSRHEIILFTGKGRNEALLPHINDACFKVYTSGFISRKSEINKIIVKFLWFFFRVYLRQFDIESFSFFLTVLFKPDIMGILKTCDVIVTVYFRDSMLFSRYLSKRKVPCVFYIPGDVHLKRFFKIDKSIYYLSISNTRKELIENRDGVKIDGVVTPGIPQVYLEPSSENSKNQNNLLFVGRLDNQKGLDDLIVIFEKTKISYPGLKLTLVGDGPERKRIEGLIAEKGLSEDINITGQIPQTEIQRYYQNAALLLHPADRESFCIVVLEAMAFGLPVIATDLPEIREASEGEAILLSKSDLNLWAKEIRFLLENPKLRERLSVKGREVARRHTWGVKSLEFEKSLKEAVEKHNEGVRRIAG